MPGNGVACRQAAISFQGNLQDCIPVITLFSGLYSCNYSVFKDCIPVIYYIVGLCLTVTLSEMSGVFAFSEILRASPSKQQAV